MSDAFDHGAGCLSRPEFFVFGGDLVFCISFGHPFFVDVIRLTPMSNNSNRTLQASIFTVFSVETMFGKGASVVFL